jgi:hypothetical protein
MVYVDVVTYAAGRRALLVWHVHVPTKNSIDEKLGLFGAGIGVLSTCARAYAGKAAADIIASAATKPGKRIKNLLL